MTDPWLKRGILSAIVLLVLHAVGTWAYTAFGVPAAVMSAGFVCVVSVFCARMAIGRGNNAWFVVPTVLFTAVPLAARSWTLLNAHESWWTRTVEFAPFLVGFAAPVFLLLAIYLALVRRARPASTQSPSQASASSSLSNTRVASPTAVASRSMWR